MANKPEFKIIARLDDEPFLRLEDLKFDDEGKIKVDRALPENAGGQRLSIIVRRDESGRE